MIVFLEIALLLILAIFMKEKNFKKYGMPILMISITIIVGTRNILGIDDNSYRQIFEHIRNGKLWAIGNIENSFIILTRILILMKFNYKMLFLLYSVFTYYFLYLVVKKLDLTKSEFILFFLSYLIICFVPYITIMRQTLSIALIFFASYLMKENKIKSSIAVAILATFFHNTAFLCLPIIFIFNEKVYINKFVKIIFPLICLVLGNTNIVIYVARFFNNLLNLKYIQYLTISETRLVGAGLFVLVRFILYLFQFLFKQKDERSDFFEKGQMLFYSIFYMTPNVGFMRRFSNYFMIYETFLLVSLINKMFNEKQRKLVIYLITIVLIILVIYILEESSLAGTFDFSNFSFRFRE